MSELIFHHYDFSNFSEKIRLVFGLKDLNWHSVTIPAYLPKPDYLPLTAGYRRTPALQIGADVYCDTALIAEVLDALYPEPTLYPGERPSRARAVALALIQWAEITVMRPTALYISGLHAEKFPEAFHADRAKLHGKPQPSVEQVKRSAEKYRSEVLTHLETLNDLLDNNSQYVGGAHPGLADFSLYEIPWFLHTIGGKGEVPEALVHLHQWQQRIADIGHGRASEMSATRALEIAAANEPEPLEPPDAEADVAPGTPVEVTTFDQHTPARGELVQLQRRRITIRTTNPRTGTVHVHFPRLGYRLKTARA